MPSMSSRRTNERLTPGRLFGRYVGGDAPGLDIDDRSCVQAIERVYRQQTGRRVTREQPHDMQADRIGPDWRAGGKYADDSLACARSLDHEIAPRAIEPGQHGDR